MEILNHLAVKKFEATDDLLAFISIYDDTNRTKAYKKMMHDNNLLIQNKVCVEAGAGLGMMSEYMLQIGAKHVYAIETNKQLFKICKKRLSKYKNATVIHSDIRDFKPKTKIDLLLHELFGQLVFDEDLFVLHQLKFKPDCIMPDSATLKYGLTSLKKMKDEIITPTILEQMNGVLISGLFDGDKLKPNLEVIKWNAYKTFPKHISIQLKKSNADLIYYGIEIYHQQKFICRSEVCNNWSFAWTPIAGKKFTFRFKQRDRLSEPDFFWK